MTDSWIACEGLISIPRSGFRSLALGLVAAMLIACSEQTPVLHDEAPLRLSDWQLFSLEQETLTPDPATLAVRPASTLFTDYAQKLRTLWVPDGQQVEVVDGELSYPPGTILSKTFYYPRSAGGGVAATDDRRAQNIDLTANRIIETRLLVRGSEDWRAYPYVWNEEQSEAFLRVAGASLSLSLQFGDNGETKNFTYFVPNQNQCAGCHQRETPDGPLQPLGARLQQLSSNFLDTDDESQLSAMQARGWLADATAADTAVDWSDANAPLQDRALAYLNINCAHCHNPKGPADTSGLILDGTHRSLTELGVCKPPVAAGGGAGSLRYGIVPGLSESSIMVYRMQSQAPDEMMPELGRTLVHDEGLALIRTWIDTLQARPCPD